MTRVMQADYYGRAVSVSVDCHTITLTSGDIERALSRIESGAIDVLDRGVVVLNESDLIEMRNLITARLDRIADLRLERSMGWQE